MKLKLSTTRVTKTPCVMKLLLTVYLLFSTICFSQKIYEFDYLIEYEQTFYKDSLKIPNHKFREKEEKRKIYYLTNSKKNNYNAFITELDSLNYQMFFKDEKGISANVKVLKSELFKAEFIDIDCNSVSHHFHFRYQTKNYDFFQLNDTLINGKSYARYKLASIKPKRVKKKKIGTKFYIIAKETSFHLPILDFYTAYQQWKTNKNIPNGIFYEKYFIEYNGKLSTKVTLINYWKTDQKIVIDEACDYTKKR
ncbi:hypothetical protein LX77_01550 [Gelidibacter algens]|uniref:GLPGLI family protein n=1 Tax=Gelidibacter algens TaxID=49280 RepID=A0A1A7R5B1_9FLAO|nr:hypothetical protein [Gelidibacter algens]OBX25947.1 hypothetical protein A9996_07465 [Gelidibacter algens]RAJ25248.1 hypothetical protein LX77_01550 [Gelidibacter algens]